MAGTTDSESSLSFDSDNVRLAIVHHQERDPTTVQRHSISERSFEIWGSLFLAKAKRDIILSLLRYFDGGFLAASSREPAFPWMRSTQLDSLRNHTSPSSCQYNRAARSSSSRRSVQQAGSKNSILNSKSAQSQRSSLCFPQTFLEHSIPILMNAIQARH